MSDPERWAKMKPILRISLTVVILGAAMLGGLAYAYSEDKPKWTDHITLLDIRTNKDIEGAWALNGWTGYMGTALQLKDGRFSYWFYSDVSSGQEPKYPVTGKYKIRNGLLMLDETEGLRETKWIWGIYGGHEGLWPDSTLDVIIRRAETPDVRMLKHVSSAVNPEKPIYNAPERK